MGFGSSTLMTCIGLPLALVTVFVTASCAKGADAEDIDGIGDSRDAASERSSLPPNGDPDDGDVTKALQNTDFGWRVDDVHFVVK